MKCVRKCIWAENVKLLRKAAMKTNQELNYAYMHIHIRSIRTEQRHIATADIANETETETNATKIKTTEHCCSRRKRSEEKKTSKASVINIKLPPSRRTHK